MVAKKVIPIVGEVEMPQAHESVAAVRKELEKEKGKVVALRKVLDVAILHLQGDGYPSREAKLALDQINIALKQVK